MSRISHLFSVPVLGLLLAVAAQRLNAQSPSTGSHTEDAAGPGRPAWNVGTSIPLPIAGVPQQIWVSAAPDDRDRLLACAFEDDAEHGLFRSSAYVSLDSGNTWMRTLSDDHSDWVSETSCAAGSLGRAYFVAGVSDTSQGTMRHEWGSLEAYRSIDGGLSWSQPRRYPFVDWTSLGALGTGRNESIVLFGNVQASGIGDRGAGSWNEKTKPLLVSSDGLSFAAPEYPVESSDSKNAFPLSVVVPSPDVVLALYAEIPENVFSIYRWNGARYERISTIPMPRGVKPYGPLSAHMAIDKTGKFRGRLYAAIPGVEERHPVVVLAHSDDQGKNWNAKVLLRRATELSEQAIEYFSAGVAVNPEGVVGVEWLAGSDCPLFAISSDGGRSPSEQHPLGRCGGKAELSAADNYWKVYNDRSPAEHPLQFSPMALPGVTIQAGSSLLASVQIAADAGGRFHVFWEETDRAGPITYTATVSRASAVEEPRSLAGMTELTDHLLIRVLRESFDERMGTFRIDLQIRNQTSLPILYPAILEVASARSDCGGVRALNAWGTSERGSALFRVPRFPDRSELFPEEASLPVHLEVRADGCAGTAAQLVDTAKHQALHSRAVFPLVLRLRIFAPAPNQDIAHP